MTNTASQSAPLRCLVVDDDPLAMQVLVNCIGNTDFLTLAGTCGSAVEATSFLRSTPIDLLFLDVEMPQMSGLELVPLLPQPPPQVVLVTSHRKFAVEAFDLAVADYLVKPVSYARFLQAAQTAQAAAAARLAPAPDEQDSAFTFVKVDSKLVRINFDEVKYVEAVGDYVNILVGSRKLLIYSTMKAIEDKFPAQYFLRVHRSHLVNIDFIDAIEDNSVVVGDKYFPIGKTYAAEVSRRLNKL